MVFSYASTCESGVVFSALRPLVKMELFSNVCRLV